MSDSTNAEVRQYLGASEDEIDRELTAFARTASLLSSDHPRLLDAHPQEWIGIYDGRVAGSARKLTTLLDQLRERNIPTAQTIVRFIDNEDKNSFA